MNTYVSILVIPLLVAILSGIFLFFIMRMFQKRDLKDERIEKLRKEAEALKEINIREWRETYSQNQCRIKDIVERIEIALNDKVDKSDCIRETKDKWDAISELRREKNQ